MGLGVHDLGVFVVRRVVVLFTLLVLACVGQAALLVQTKDEGLADSKWTKPRIYVRNTGTAPESFSRIRYFFRVDPGKTPELAVWDPIGTPGSITLEPDGRAFAEIDLGYTTLAPGESLRWGNGVLIGLHNQDWSDWTKTDDFSAVAVQGNVVDNSRIVLTNGLGEIQQGTDGMTVGTLAPDCWGTYALLAGNQIQAGDRTHIQGASVLAKGSATMGFDSWLDDGSLYSGGNIWMNDRTKVEGDVLAGTLLTRGYNTVVQGVAQSWWSPVPSCPVEALESFSAGTEDVAVGQNQTRILAPGRYRNLDVSWGATLQLTGGEYYFSNLILRPDAKMKIASGSDPVRISLTGAFEFGDRSQVLFAGTVLPRRVQLLSISSATSKISNDAKIMGSFHAPLADVRILSRAKVTGGVVAKNIFTDPDVSIQWSQPIVRQNLPPVLILKPLVVAYGWEASLSLVQVQIQDPDSPLDQLIFTLKSLPAGGVLNQEGRPMHIGDTFSLLDLERLRISYSHTNGTVRSDSFAFEVSDGVNWVAGVVAVSIMGP